MQLQISFMVTKDAEVHKTTLRYFMEQFYGIIRNVDSNNKELSIAIRGYGLFAGVWIINLFYIFGFT
jgi:DNA-dependent protein kinase catalytic subunit